jgi:RND family efflux transporter MFP subunit
MTAHDEMQTAPKDVEAPPKKPSTWSIRVLALCLLLLAAGVTAFGIVARNASEATLAQWTDDQATPTVAVTHATVETQARVITLPGDIEAFYQAVLYARVPGYLKMWYKDIGAQVKAGDVLADISTPDLDQQVDQARADLASAKANAALAELTARRWKALLSSNAVSQQTTDEKAGDAVVKATMVNARAASLQRLMELEGFRHIVAPFAGVVTARRTDVGALINVGSGGGPALFDVADIHAMRIYVRVPQALSSAIQNGTEATLTLPQYPGRVFTAKVVTSSNAVQAASRTVLVQLQADNPDGALLPGTFAQVSFHLPPAAGVLQLPATALIFQAHGLQVATAEAGGRVALHDVEIGRDLGTAVEVLSGITAADLVILNPPDTITAGQTVRIETAAAPAKPAAQAEAEQ